MPGKFTLSVWDYDKESSTVSVPTVEIDETNLVAQNAAMATLYLAINAVCLGTIFKDVRTFEVNTYAGVAPNDRDAQREKKWVVKMRGDVTHKPYTMEIPCADLSLLDAEQRGSMDHDLTAYTDLVAAIEALYIPEFGDTAVIVEDIVFAGRNL